MKPFICTLSLALILGGCASYGVIVSEKQANQFKRGETTERDIVAALGRPSTITNTKGQRSIAYTGVQAQVRPETFIPFVGAFVGGSDAQTTSVAFSFDAAGRLLDVVSSQSNSGYGMGFAAGKPISKTEDQPRNLE
jgi:outer membrane protein assembly factor BamE (lipoprotein component of BamABCDE complex)